METLASCICISTLTCAVLPHMSVVANIALQVFHHVGRVVVFKLIFSIKEFLVSTTFARPLVGKVVKHGATIQLRNSLFSFLILLVSTEYVKNLFCMEMEPGLSLFNMCFGVLFALKS